MRSRAILWLTTLGLFLMVAGTALFLLWAPVPAPERFWMSVGLVGTSLVAGLALDLVRPRMAAVQLLVGGSLLFPLIFRLAVEAGYLVDTGDTYRVVLLTAGLDGLLWAITRRSVLAYLSHLAVYLALGLWLRRIQALPPAYAEGMAVLALTGLSLPRALNLTDRDGTRPFWGPGLFGLLVALAFQYAQGDEVSLAVVAWAVGLGLVAVAPHFFAHRFPRALGYPLLPFATALTIRALHGSESLGALLTAGLALGITATERFLTDGSSLGSRLSSWVAVAVSFASFDLPMESHQLLSGVALGLAAWAIVRSGHSGVGCLLALVALDQLSRLAILWIGLPASFRVVIWSMISLAATPPRVWVTVIVAIVSLALEFPHLNAVPGLTEASLFGLSVVFLRLSRLPFPLDLARCWFPVEWLSPRRCSRWLHGTALAFSLAALWMACSNCGSFTVGLAFAVAGLGLTVWTEAQGSFALVAALIAFAQAMTLAIDGSKTQAEILFVTVLAQAILTVGARSFDERISGAIVAIPALAAILTPLSDRCPVSLLLWILPVAAPLMALSGWRSGAWWFIVPGLVWAVLDPIDLWQNHPTLGVLALVGSLATAWILRSGRLALLTGAGLVGFLVPLVLLRGPGDLVWIKDFLLAPGTIVLVLLIGRPALPVFCLQLVCVALREGMPSPIFTVLLGLSGLRAGARSFPIVLASTAILILGAPDLYPARPELPVTAAALVVLSFSWWFESAWMEVLSAAVLVYAWMLGATDAVRTAIAVIGAIGAGLVRKDEIALAFVLVAGYAGTRAAQLDPVVFGLGSLVAGSFWSLTRAEEGSFAPPPCPCSSRAQKGLPLREVSCRDRLSGGLALANGALLLDLAWHPESYLGRLNQPVFSLALAIAGLSHAVAWSRSSDRRLALPAGLALVASWFLGLDAVNVGVAEVYLLPVAIVALAFARDEAPAGSFRRDELAFVGFAILFAVSFLQSMPGWSIDPMLHRPPLIHVGLALAQGALLVILGTVWNRQGLMALGAGSLVLEVGAILSTHVTHGIWGKAAMIAGLGICFLVWALRMERPSDA